MQLKVKDNKVNLEYPVYPINELHAISYHQSISSISHVLNDLGSNDLFYEEAFHQALEEFPPGETYFRYVIVWEKNTPVGFLYYQIKKIDLGESLEGSHDSDQSFAIQVRKKLARKINFYTLVNGNMLQTGNYGRFFVQDKKDCFDLKNLEVANNIVLRKLKKEGYKIVGILMKDFYEKERFSDEEIRAHKFSEFSVQPNMQLDIRKNWKTKEDYLNDLKSKYKVRTRRTIKKLDGVEKRELTLDDLLQYKDRMHELYKTIATQASFNLFILNDLYFYGLKKHLKDNIDIIGYFLEDKMIGFFTIIHNYKVLDAHFLGYDATYNREKHLYHNMLYDLLFKAIGTGKEHLDLSRTALEIKSSIGAKASSMYLYLKTVNSMANLFTSRALKFLTPEEKWIERNPFKG